MRLDTCWLAGVLVLAAIVAVGDVSFVARTQFFSFRGTCKAGIKPAWSPFTKTFHVELPLSCFDTGIVRRNNHMLLDLGASKHPVATMRYALTGTKSFSGTLSLNGVSQPVSGAVLQSPERYVFKILLSDFGIPASSRFGIKVQNEVEVTAEL